MKNGLNNKNKKIIILVLCIAMLCLTGYGFWQRIPQLINADLPFIDLEASTDGAIGNAETAYNLLQEKEQPTPTPELTPVPTPVPTEAPKNIVEVFVGSDEFNSDDIVIIGDKRFSSTDTDKISDLISAESDNGKKIIIVDDFAEKNAFISVINICRELDCDFEITDENGIKTE